MKLNLRKIQVSHYIAIKSLSVLKKKHPSGSLYGFVAKVVTAAVLFLGALAFFWQRIDFFVEMALLSNRFINLSHSIIKMGD